MTIQISVIKQKSQQRISADFSIFFYSVTSTTLSFFQYPRLSKNFANSTRPNMMGTSQNNPIVVPNAANDPTPYMATAAAIAISKWLEDPIKTVTTASL